MAGTSLSYAIQKISLSEDSNTDGTRIENDIELSRADHTDEGLYSNTSNIPVDIWREIFLHCLAGHSDYPTTPSNTKPPLIFTQVCRSWRDIALHTPRLWNNLRIICGGPVRIKEFAAAVLHAQKTKKGVGSWLERSGVLPLAVSIELRRTRFNETMVLDDEPEMCLFETIELVSQRSERLKSLSIAGRDLMPLFLRSFSLTDVDTSTTSLLHLSDLSLTFFYAIFVSKQLDYPSTILRRLAPQCPSLVSCSLHFERGRFPTNLPLSTSAIIWPSLTHLVLSFDYHLSRITREMLRDTFDSIRAPSLTFLDLSITPEKHQEILWVQPLESLEAPFHGFLVESNCHLISLGLHMPFGWPVIRTIDELLSPSLKRLTISNFTAKEYHGTRVSVEDAYTPDYSTTYMVIHHLTPVLNASYINLPNLEELEIECPGAVYDTRRLWSLKTLGSSRSWKRFRVLFTDVTEIELAVLTDVKKSERFSGGEGVHWEYYREGDTAVFAVV